MNVRVITGLFWYLDPAVHNQNNDELFRFARAGLCNLAGGHRGEDTFQEGGPLEDGSSYWVVPSYLSAVRSHLPAPPVCYEASFGITVNIFKASG